MMEQPNRTFDVIQVCLLAGKLMIENGAETYRVEDTMERIAASYGNKNAHSFVTPTGIIFSIDGTEPTKLVRISTRSTNLHKVTLVNSISREISEGGITPSEAYRRLKEVEEIRAVYSTVLQTAAAAIASGCFLIMYEGRWIDFLPAFICGGLGFACSDYLHRLVQFKFFAEFMASLLIGVLSVIFVSVGIGSELDKIIIGSVMPLVPGLLITNAVRDLIAGHLVSGLSKGAEAFLASFAIGTGIAVVLSFIK